MLDDSSGKGGDVAAPLIRVKFLGRCGSRKVPEVWLRQLPGGVPRLGRCSFTFEPDDREYDWLVVYDDLPAAGSERFSLRSEPLACPREHTLLVTTEPSSIKRYGRAFLRQFGHVLSSQEPWAIRHPRHIRDQCGLRWFYGLGNDGAMREFDAIEQNPPLEKSAVISTVCSAKRQRHTLHNDRYTFTMAVKKYLPELDIFGHGVRDMNDKAEALDSYRYHIAIENHIAPRHWTEKLADCFLGCVLPFYHGAPDAGRDFPPESFIPIDFADPAGAAGVIREAIEGGEYEKRLPFILEARRLVLHRYNLFSVLERTIGRLHSASAAPTPGTVIRSRRAARRASPAAALLDAADKLRMRFGRRARN